MRTPHFEEMQASSGDRLRRSMGAEEAERRRIARELTDGTLEELAAIQLSLAGALRDEKQLEPAALLALDQLGGEIKRLRGVIARLSPAVVHEVGLRDSIRGLALDDPRLRDLEIEVDVEMPSRAPGDPWLAVAVYRLVAAALDDIADRGHIRAVSVEVRVATDTIRVSITDDGRPRPAGSVNGELRRAFDRIGAIGGIAGSQPADGPGSVVSAILPLPT